MKFKKIKEIVLFGVINLLFISSALLFISTVYDVQISNSEYFQNQALSYREKVEILEAARGSIYDRNLNVVASSIQSYDIGIRPNEVSNKEELSELLSVFLQLESIKILQELETRKGFFLLSKRC